MNGVSPSFFGLLRCHQCFDDSPPELHIRQAAKASHTVVKAERTPEIEDMDRLFSDERSNADREKRLMGGPALA
jgi:hypothetical protein